MLPKRQDGEIPLRWEEQEGLWAPTLLVHGGKPQEITAPVGATQQVRTERGFSQKSLPYFITVALGAGIGGTNIQPPPRSLRIPFDNAYDASTLRTFRLRVDIDCYVGRGRGYLRTPKYEWLQFWSHPFVAQPGGGPQPAPIGITVAGVGLAMPNGSGTRSVTVKDFSIFAWDAPAPWVRHLFSGM